MKKTLIAVAALAAVGAASAQSSVTAYGIVDLSITSSRGNAAGTNVTRLDSGSAAGSRLGFRGTEDLGGGLKANFVAETGFCADSNAPATGNAAGTPNFCTGGNNFMGRQAFVGLSGGFGTLNLGRQYTPAFVALTALDPFGSGTDAQAVTMFENYGGYQTNQNYTGNPRNNNAIQYSLPNLGGLFATVNYSLGEVAGNNTAGRGTGLSAGYANGPLYVVLAYQKTNNATASDSRKGSLLGATYDLGVAKLHFGYGRTKNDTLTNTVGVLVQYGDAANTLLGVTVPLGSGALKASYVRHNDRSATNYDANQFGIGYDYNLSKRTTVYTVLSKVSNKNGAFYTTANATVAGIGDKAFNLGVRHSF